MLFLKTLGVLAIFCLAIITAGWSKVSAHSQEVVLGGVTVKLPAPAGHCTLDRKVHAEDANMLDMLDTAFGNTANKLLSATADCTELNDWRQGRRAALDNIAQYQITKIQAVPPRAIQPLCASMRAQGDKVVPAEVTAKSQAAIDTVSKNYKINETRQLGVLAEEAATCYVAQLLKRTIDGQAVEELVMLAITVVKGRLIFYYLYGAPGGDKSVIDLLAEHQASVAALHAANR